MSSPADGLAWDVVLPQRKAASLSGTKICGTVSIREAHGKAEQLAVPVAVARWLVHKREAGELRPTSRAEVLYHIREASLACASARIAKMVDRRDYTAKEVCDRLRRDGYAQRVVSEVVAHAKEVGLIDEPRFADVFIRTKLSAGWGCQRIERELRQRGIEPSEVNGWPYGYLSADDEQERALAVARTRRIAETRGYEKLVRYLSNRGFSLGVSMRAAQQVIDEVEACE